MSHIIDHTEVIKHWGKVEPLLNRVLAKFDYGSDADDILADVICGHRHIWNINDFDGIAVTQICTLPKFRVLDISLLCGDNMNVWLDALMGELVRYAKFEGCKYIDGFGRKGWTKKLEAYGFKPYSYDVRLQI